MDPCQYIQERTQKITEALYRVTDLFSDKEPIKWLLRKKGINIFNCLSFLGDDSPNRRLKNIGIVSGLISSILRVLEVASAGAFISAVNFEVLQREYRALADFISNSKKDILPSPTALLFDSVPKEVLSESSPKGHSNGQKANCFAFCPIPGEDGKSPMRQRREAIGGQAGLPSADSLILQEVSQDGIKDFNGHALIVKDTKIQEINNKNKEKFNSSSNNVNIKNEAEVKFDRQKKILEFVKNNGWVGVREVSTIFDKNISEKTIQRDLIVMADSGALRKAGDKRWRRYAVV